MRASLARVANGGARSLSLREVARDAGVSHAAAYRHFRNKEDLLAAIAEQGFRELTLAIRDAAALGPADALSALQAAGVAYVEFGVTHPQHLQLMFGGYFDDGSYPALAAAGHTALEGLVGLIRRATAERLIAPESEQEAAIAAWSQVHGLTHLIINGKAGISSGDIQGARRLAANVTQLLRDGLQSSSGRSR